MTKLSKEKVDLLLNETPSKKIKTNVPFYDILANQTYRLLFEYDSHFLEFDFECEEKESNVTPTKEVLVPGEEENEDDSEQFEMHFHNEN